MLWGETRLVTCDFNLLKLEFCAKNVQENWAQAWAGKQQLKRMQSRGAAVEVDAIGEQLSGRNWGASAKADAIAEQQPQSWSSN